jgi:hypothetical protein
MTFTSIDQDRWRGGAVYAAVLLAVIAAGLTSRYPGLLPWPVAKWSGSVLWAAMVYLLVCLVAPRAAPNAKLIAALAIACASSSPASIRRRGLTISAAAPPARCRSAASSRRGIFSPMRSGSARRDSWMGDGTGEFAGFEAPYETTGLCLPPLRAVRPVP